MKAKWKIAFALLFVIVACRRDGETLRFGISNMSYSLNGASLAIEEINSAGGINGKNISMVIDTVGTGNNSEKAVQAAAYFSSRKDILAFIGYTASAPCLAASQVFNQNGMPQIVPSATSPLLSKAGPWTFRVCVSDEFQGQFLADYVVNKLGKERIAVFYVNDDYGRGLKDSFINRIKKWKREIVIQIPYLENSDFDFEPSLRNIKQKSPDIIFFAGRPPEILYMLQKSKELGIFLPVIGGDGLYHPTKLNTMGTDLIEGVMITLFFHPSQKNKRARKFVQHFKERYGTLPEAIAALTYDAVYLLKRAIEEGGANRRKIRDYLVTIGNSNPAFDGVTGKIAFDKNGDCIKPLTIGIVRNGTPVPLDDN